MKNSCCERFLAVEADDINFTCCVLNQKDYYEYDEGFFFQSQMTNKMIGVTC
jgi:hypothetical protein